MKHVLLLALVAGCFPTRSQELTCDVTADCDDGRVCESGFCVATPSNDAGVDPDSTEEPDGPPAFDCTPFTTKFFVGCDLPEPTGSIDIAAAATYNTDTSTLSTGEPVPSINVAAGHVISVQSFRIAGGATLRVTGSKPLIIASWSTLVIDGTIDASSNTTELGAGANPADCSTHAPVAGQAENDGGGGGGGGSMIAAGGRGGNGDDNSVGGAGGAALATPPLLLGGCPGAAGGNGRQPAGAGGAGGGAVALTALESITVTGNINAGGAGGLGAAGENGGGGGGGSGGMIALESAAVSVSGTIAANGGGGGGGSTDNNNATGSPGQPGQLSATRATGGPGNNNGGGAGGLGGAGATAIGGAGQNGGNDAGGGGGGSCGFVVVASTAAATLGGTISPVATQVPR